MPILPISNRLVVQIALAASLAGAVSHWAAAQAVPEACQVLRRDLDAAIKARNLDAAKDANHRIQTGVGCHPLRIDAPLDDANIGRFVEMLQGMQEHTQFIIITHSRKTMEIADRLYGVTMEEPGVSKLISLELN